jgi:hypothetical protein
MTPIPLGILALAGITGGGGAFDLLETTTLTSSASSVTFTGLGAYSDYKHLQIRAVGRTDADGSLWVQLNNDTGSDYARHTLLGQGSSVISNAASSQGFINFNNVFVGNTEDANSSIFGSAVVDFLDFASASKKTTLRALGGSVHAGYTAINLSSGLWNNTASVTTIKLYYSASNFVSGTRFSLFGVKGTS